MTMIMSENKHECELEYKSLIESIRTKMSKYKYEC